MQIAQALNARTFLTHLFVRGLEDSRYVVERFQSMADGGIRRWPGEEPKARKRTPQPAVASLKTVREMRPARNEIIVCTGLNLKDSGVQYWGACAVWRHMSRR